MKNELILKKVRVEDLRNIWIWRNNAETRKNSFNRVELTCSLSAFGRFLITDDILF